MKPKRIQLSRKRGWRMPPNTVVVSRPSRWGNPYLVKDALGGHAEAVAKFKRMLQYVPSYVAEIKAFLRGKHLACWCKPGEPCHADVLLEIANQ